jgi:CysZ protein
MRFFRNMYVGIVSHFAAVRLIFSTTLWWFMLIPAVLSVGLYYGGGFLEVELRSINLQQLPDVDYEYDLLLIGLKAIAVFMAIKMSKYIIISVLVPVLAVLSAKAEYKINGVKYKMTFRQYIIDMKRGMSIMMRNIVWHSLLLLIWHFVLLFFPDIDYLDWPVQFVIGFYFYGFWMIDYTSERRRLGIRESYRFIHRHMGLTLVIGAGFSAMFLLPYVGVAFAPIISTVAATIGVHRVTENDAAAKKKSVA